MFAMTAMWGCEDDFNPDMGGVVDGSLATVPISISFDSETSVDISSRAMGAQDGLAMQDINSFWMVIYNQDGTLYKKYHIREGGNNVTDPSGDVTNIKYNPNSDNRLPDEGNLGDDAAGRLDFDLKLTSARYYIYGVANVKDFDKKDISTRDRLKRIECAWDSTSIANNTEMFGIFSVGQNRGATDNSPIAVTVKAGQAQQLHCWLRRLASKVTIAFDGSELYDNVEVYIDTIMVRDVPKKCILGMPNHPGQADPDDPENRLEPAKRYDVDNGVYRFGGIESLQQLTAADLQSLSPLSYYHVCNSSHIYGGEGSVNASDPAINKHKHSHSSPALYFYENLQGEGKDKTQSLDGTTIWKPNPVENNLDSGWKDGKAYGTYIEVRGYYRNTASDGKVSQGWIKYRFMLGQDAKTDYNALRNTHYKVTLKLKGYGNDYDWHIDYKEDTGIFMTSPQFISYLYNKSMYATIKVVGEMDPTYGLQATLLDNSDTKFTEWGPWGDDKTNAYGEMEYPDPNNVTIDGHRLFLNKVNKDATGAYTSFLSLRKTSVLRIEPDGSSGLQSWQIDTKQAYATLKSDYEGKEKGTRTYAAEADKVPENDDKNGRYTLQETRMGINKDGKEVAMERLYRIPLYTRAKELVTKTGLSGNNPYVAYPRKMVVRFTAKIRNEITGFFDPVSFDLDVIQVRRIVNPKGVWRASNSSDPFEVTLKRLPQDNADNFVEFKSIGKWSAEVVSQSDPVISLTSTTKGSGDAVSQTNVRRIEGEDEHPINFKINFHGAKSGYAVVRVRYHNYTCEHDIFCMVGKEPVQLNPDGGMWWMPTNVYRFDSNHKAVYAESPLQEGSLFRRGSYIAITPDNNPVNNYKLTSGSDPSFKVLKEGSTTKTSLKWSECKVPHTDANFKDWQISNKDERIASCHDDFYKITSPSNDLEYPIKKAYGVLYGEGADSVASKVLDAYGYDDENGGESHKGMMGVFVYNSNNARAIFLPLGKSGHGRRKKVGGWAPSPVDPAGSMRYATRSAAYDGAGEYTYNNDTKKYGGLQPMFYDLYRRPGALYWCKRYYDSSNWPKNPASAGGGNDVSYSESFDINYFTMGFEGFGGGAVYVSGNTTESDACFIRTVRITPPHLNNWFSVFYNIFSRFLPKAEILEGCFVHIYGGICLTMKKLLSCI